MRHRGLGHWLPSYIATARSRGQARRDGLTHIIFLICDHFEPRHGIKHEDQAAERIRTWKQQYALLQDRCRTEFSNVPLHTWFYPPHHGFTHLPNMADLVFAGLGEVELHYHHSDDTSASLRRDLKATIAEYQRWGLLLEVKEGPRTAFGFIHGDWALDNSANGKYCGVNDELTILQDCGCWGDFTMPSANECQTRKINSIYYAVDDPQRPKSHDWGLDASVGRITPQGLFMLQGPLAINWRAPRYPRIENASLTSENWGRPDRIRKWIDCQIHVKGRPEWLFVKLHAHGAVEKDQDALFGEKALQMHRVLNEHYNDGLRYRVHYVTARQAYNIAKAAERGLTGDPSQYVDLCIGPPANRYYAANVRHRLERCSKSEIWLSEIEAPDEGEVRLAEGPVSRIAGRMNSLRVEHNERRLAIDSGTASAQLALDTKPSFQILQLHGGRQIKSHDIPNGQRVYIESTGILTIEYASDMELSEMNSATNKN